MDNEFKIQVKLDKVTLEQVKAENRKLLIQMKEDSKRSILELNQQNKLKLIEVQKNNKSELEDVRRTNKARETAVRESKNQEKKAEQDHQKYKESLRKQELNQEKISYNAREKLTKEHADKLRRVDRETESQRKKDDALQRRVQERGLSQTFSSQSGRGFGDAESWTKVGIGIAAVTAAAVAFGNAVIKAWAEQESANTKLLFALERNQSAFGNLQEQAKRLQETTIFADEQVMEAQSFLAVQGRTEEQIRKTIEAAANLAAVEGTDLMTAVQKLDMTYEGSIGRLGRRIGKLKDLTETELREGKAIDIVNERYKDYAETVGNTLTGKVSKLQNAFGELKEAAGKGVLEGFSFGLGDATRGVDGLTKEMLILQKTVEVVAAGIAFTMRVTVVGAIATILTKLDEWKSKQEQIDKWAANVQAGMDKKVNNAVNDILSGKRNLIYPEAIGPEKPTEKTKTSRGGSPRSPRIEQEEKVLTLYQQQLEVVKKIEEALALNAGDIGAVSDLTKQLLEAKQELTRLGTGLGQVTFGKDITEDYTPDRNLSLRTMQRVITPEMMWQAIDWGELTDRLHSAVSGVSEVFTSLMDSLNIKADSFVGTMVSGFDKILSIINTIVATLNAVNAVKGLLSFIPGGSIIGGLAGGGDAMPMMNGGGMNIIVHTYSQLETQKATRVLYDYTNKVSTYSEKKVLG